MSQRANTQLKLGTRDLTLPWQCKSRAFPWSQFWTTFGMLILFVAALILVLRWNPQPLDDDAERALLRVKNLAELRRSDETMLTTYGWINKSQGIVRLPIERAMELEIKSLNDPQWKPHQAYSIAPIDLIPKQAGMPSAK